MEDRQFLTLLQDVSTQTSAKHLSHTLDKLIQILLAAEKQAQISQAYADTEFGRTFKDLQYAIEKAVGGLQSTDYNTQRNHALLLGSILSKFQFEVRTRMAKLQIQVQEVVGYAKKKLSAKEAYNKSESKHFSLGLQMLFTELHHLGLLEDANSVVAELTHKDDPLAEGNVFILLKLM